MSALPATMTCVEIKTPGGPEALVPATRPVPQPKAGELLIKVAATGVNRPDLAQRAGHYPPPPGASDLPGLEAAGTVAAIGSGVSGWKEGDAVCALTPGGSYAEYCTAPAPQCLPPPKGFDMLRAAALPENYFTVWHNLFERGQLKSGESRADPWRGERHRHDGDPACQGVRRHGVHHRPHRREGRRRQPSSAPTMPCSTRTTTGRRR